MRDIVANRGKGSFEGMAPGLIRTAHGQRGVRDRALRLDCKVAVLATASDFPLVPCALTHVLFPSPPLPLPLPTPVQRAPLQWAAGGGAAAGPQRIPQGTLAIARHTVASH